MAVFVGSVEPFPDVVPDKAQALKPLEEAAEAFGAWQTLAYWQEEAKDCVFALQSARCDVLNEIADTIQACCNLAHAMGCEDLTPYMAACEERNRKRGRYEDKR
jgi:hypothetical protein